MFRHFRSLQVIENVSKPKIAFSVYDEKNSKEGIFRGSHKSNQLEYPAVAKNKPEEKSWDKEKLMLPSLDPAPPG